MATRNQRLTAIRSLFHFISQCAPELVDLATQIETVPLRKTSFPVISYLEKDEMDALLAAPDRRRSQGQRDYALLLFLYNTGARADEAAHTSQTLASALVEGCVARIRYRRSRRLWIARKRPLALLDKKRENPAVWIVAPPGAGKTTLAASYFDEAKASVIWYDGVVKPRDLQSRTGSLRNTD